MRLAIDASRCRSGGAERHLAGILNNLIIDETPFTSILVWIPQSFSEELPSAEWLEIRHPRLLINNLIGELVWQACSLSGLLKGFEADILLTADASSLCFFSPNVVISQDLSSFEPEVMKSAGGMVRLRLQIIKWIQVFSLRRAETCIYQSSYAQSVINSVVRSDKESAVIAHGVGSPEARWSSEKFLRKKRDIDKYKCLYVSPFAHYKKQLELVKAIRICRNQGLDLSLELIGGGAGDYADQVLKEIEISKQEGCKIIVKGFMNHKEVLESMSDADLFLFPSTCETFGITLAEAMSIGVPIICANSSSLPDLLEDGGLYCDPNRPASISDCILEAVSNPIDTVNRAALARKISGKLSWRKASVETFKVIERSIVGDQKANM
ncbi:glycosyltransferase [Candidatus Peregrinibacteria bacterium]|jgi:glycosyltransferase involved in cell wall biosynthesis|nr:glycosyltransferase [Candidatus Peregrinibacteria bacterium]